jgi:hypothetical protein
MYSLSTRSKIHRTTAWSKSNVHGRDFNGRGCREKSWPQKGAERLRGDVQELVHSLGGWFEVLLLPKLGWSVRNESCHVISWVDKSTSRHHHQCYFYPHPAEAICPCMMDYIVQTHTHTKHRNRKRINRLDCVW